MIDDMKPIGAFIEYTVRPILAQFKWFLEELERQGIGFCEANIVRILNRCFKSYIIFLVLSIIQSIIITAMVCFTVWILLKG